MPAEHQGIAVTDAAVIESTRTPWHLWVVGIFAVLWDSMGAFDYLMTQTENEAYMANFTPEQLEFFYGFPAWLDAVWAIAVWGGLAASVLLLLRKRIAYPVFLASFVAMVITTIRNYVFSNGMEVTGGSGLVFSLVIFVLALAFVLYARLMSQRGVLT
jgi:hypothetical protein